MTIVIGLFDPDASRRTQAAARLPASLSGRPWVARRSQSTEGLDLFWETGVATPVSTATDRLDDRNRFAWVVGDYEANYSEASDAAKRLLERSAIADEGARAVSSRNGYYLAVLLAGSQLAVGTDALGMFPLYYWTAGDVCLFGTSPQFFRCHPRFVARPSPFAMASMLLVNHITGGRALFDGVRRNAAGCRVEFSPQRGAHEREADPVRFTRARFEAPYEASVDHVAGCFDAFHRSLAGLKAIDVFLSGGQDSRLVAGYAARTIPRAALRATSLGRSSDQELRYARRVSGALRWPHRFADVDFGRYAEYAAAQLRLESLQGPFASLDTWTAMPMLAERGGPFLSGYLGDAVIGDRHARAAQSPKSGQFEFDELFRNVNGFGFPLAEVCELLAPCAEARVARDVVETLRAEWDAQPDLLPFQKAWRFQLNNRQRFHFGSIIWRLSLGAWPLLPYYDRALLDAVVSMPLDHLAGRRIQSDIIVREFPRLATLPLDRNAVGPDYLITPLFRKFVPPLSEVSWTAYRLLERGVERRYYSRTYDYNAPGWRSVRALAEPWRDAAAKLFERSTLNRLLPSADQTPAYPNAVRDASKTKTLLGLVVWYGSTFGSAQARADA